MSRNTREIKRSVLPPEGGGIVSAVQLLESDHAYTFVHWEYGHADQAERLAGALKVPKGVGEISVLGSTFYETDAADFAGHAIAGQPLDSGELPHWLNLIDRALPGESPKNVG